LSKYGKILLKKATEDTEILRFPERKIYVIYEICGFFSGLMGRITKVS